MDDEMMEALAMMAADAPEMGDVVDGLSPRQQAMSDSYNDIVNVFGLFDKSDGPDGAHYIAAKDNGFKDKGIRCDGCVFWQGPNGCSIVSGNIEPAGACKLWVISEK
jgi:hypothetical protein